MFQRLAALALLACLLWPMGANAGNGVQANFSRNNTAIAAGEVASNVFGIKNFTGKSVRFSLNYSIPSGWSLLGDPERIYEVDANDSIFVPIRVIPAKDLPGGTSFVITVSLVSDRQVHFAAENWYVTLPSKSRWTASLPIRTQFFLSKGDSSAFFFNLKNEGNSDEDIRITILPDRRLEVIRHSDGGSQLLTFSMHLKVGMDTTLIFPVVRKKTQLAVNKDVDLHTKPANETYGVQVVAKSINGTGSYSGKMQFVKATDFARFYDQNRSTIPLTLEANVYDMLSNGTTMSLDAYGNMTLANNGLLNYRFQTVFISNYINQKSFLGNNNYVGYFNDRMSLEIGEVNGWGRSLLTGRGVKGSYRIGANTIGGIYTRSPGFFNNFTSEGYGVFHNLKLKRYQWSNYFSRNENFSARLSNEIYSTLVAGRIGKNHQLSAGGGYSTDHAQSANANGYGAELNYSGTFNRFSVSLGGNYGTNQYVLSRGVRMVSSRLSYGINNRHNLALSTQHFTQRPSYFSNGILIDGNYIRNDRYELRWAINSPSATVSIKPAYHWEENFLIRSESKLLGVEYNARNLPGVRFSAMGYAGYARVINSGLPDFFVSRLSAYARWEKLYLSIRYSYGPGQLSEKIRFIKDEINPQSIYAIGAYDFWLKGNKVLLSTTGNLMYETYFDKLNVRMRPELYYYAKGGIRISCYASFFTSSQGANPIYNDIAGRDAFEKTSNSEMNFGMGVRKQFGIPMPGKKFVSVRIVVFKDENGNGKKDASEVGVENMLVSIEQKNLSMDSLAAPGIKGDEIITNDKGEIHYENVPPGIYAVKCVSLLTNGEWFDSGEQEYNITSRDVIYIPLSRGVRITGSILVERDKYSGFTERIDLSRIRVTALDSAGRTYSALTDHDGTFSFNVPVGKYMVSVSESAIGDGFMFIQSKLHVDLTKNYQNLSITFNAAEKRRKMNIKKFDNSEN